MASTSAPKPDEKASTPADSKPEQSQNNKTAGALEEDDEFEDFPVEGMSFSLCLLACCLPP